jgi:hypothetical protein
MRWTIRIVVVLLVLLAAYTIWPLYGLHRLAAAVEARNAAALQELVEFRTLRRSLSEQIVLAYLKVTGKDTGLGAVGTRLAASAGATIADPIVGRLLNPESLIDLLSSGVVPNTTTTVALPPVSSVSLGNAWRTWLASEYSGRNFYVSLPPGKSAVEQFRVKLYLISGRWKLAGIDLPESLRQQLAREAMKIAGK